MATASGQPGAVVDVGTPLVITLTANTGFEFTDPHGFTLVNEDNLFDSISIVRTSSTVVTITLSVRDSERFPNSSTTINVDLIGNAVPVGVNVDFDLDGGGPLDTNGDGIGDIVIDFDDTDGNTVEPLEVDVDGDPGDTVVIGDMRVCPADGKELMTTGVDPNITVVIPTIPPRTLSNGNILTYSNGRVDENDCIVYTITLTIGNMDYPQVGDPVDLDSMDDLMNGPLPPPPDLPDDALDDTPTIFSITVDTSDLDPVEGGFINIIGLGDPGATGTVTLSPQVIGTNATAYIPNLTIPVLITGDGKFIRQIRIPAIAGDMNVNGLCETDVIDGVDGVDWMVEVEGDGIDPDNPITVDPIILRGDGQVNINIISSENTIPVITGSRVTTTPEGWVHETKIEDTVGFTYPNGVIEITIPPGTNQEWNLLDAVDGIVQIDPETDITCDPANHTFFCDGTARVVGTNLVIRQPYEGGIIPMLPANCNISLDNLATRNTEVQVEFAIPASGNFGFAPGQQSIVTYSGRPGTTVPSDGGEEPNSVVLRANTDYTWRHTDLALAVSMFAAQSGNEFTNHITNVSFSPTLASLQAAGPNEVADLTVTWTLGGVYPNPANSLLDRYIATPTGGARRLVSTTFNFGSDNRGQASLEDATFTDIAVIEGVESRPWTVNYSITPDDDHVFKNPSLITTNVHDESHSVEVSTISAPTFSSASLLTGTITGTHQNDDNTVFIDGDGKAFRNVDRVYSATYTGSNGSLVTGFDATVSGIEGDAYPSRTLTISTSDTTAYGWTAANAPTVTVGGVSVTPVFVGVGSTFGLTPVQYGNYTVTIGGGNFPDTDSTVTVAVSGSPTLKPVILAIDVTLDDEDGIDDVMITEGHGDDDSSEDSILNADGDIEVEGPMGTEIEATVCVSTTDGRAIQAVGNLDVEFPSNVTTDGAPRLIASTVAGDQGNGNLWCQDITITIPDGEGTEVDGGDITDSDNDSTIATLASLTVTPNSLGVGASAGSSTVVVNADSSSLTPTGWSSSVPSGSFLSISPTTSSADGNVTVTVTRTANTSIVDTRTDTITFNANASAAVSETLTVTQGVAAPSITGVTMVTTPAGVGMTNTLTFTTNDNWTLEGLDTTKFTADITSGSAGTNTITFTNVTGESATAVSDGVEIRTSSTMTTGGAAITQVSSSFTVQQMAAADTLTVDSATATIPRAGGSVVIGVAADQTGWTISEDDSAAGFTVTRENDTAVTVTKTTENTGTTAIDGGSFTITSELGAVVIEISISQSGITETLTISPSSLTLAQAGQSLTSTVTSNLPAGWTLGTPTNSAFTVTRTNNTTITVSKTTANAGFNLISGTVAVNSVQGSQDRTLTFSQTANTRTFGPASDTTVATDTDGVTGATIAVTSNDSAVTWAAVSSDASIVSITGGATGTVPGSITYNVAENPAGSAARSATITITYTSGGVTVATRVITITQEAVQAPLGNFVITFAPFAPAGSTNANPDFTTLGTQMHRVRVIPNPVAFPFIGTTNHRYETTITSNRSDVVFANGTQTLVISGVYTGSGTVDAFVDVEFPITTLTPDNAAPTATISQVVTFPGLVQAGSGVFYTRDKGAITGDWMLTASQGSNGGANIGLGFHGASRAPAVTGANTPVSPVVNLGFGNATTRVFGPSVGAADVRGGRYMFNSGNDYGIGVFTSAPGFPQISLIAATPTDTLTNSDFPTGGTFSGSDGSMGTWTRNDLTSITGNEYYSDPGLTFLLFREYSAEITLSMQLVSGITYTITATNPSP